MKIVRDMCGEAFGEENPGEERATVLASYGEKVKSSEHREKNYEQHAKKKQKVLDDIDIFLDNEKAKHKTTICMNLNPPQMEEEWIKCDYWDSGDIFSILHQASQSNCVSVTEASCCRTLSKMLTRLKQ
jgi:hypothetical protein